MKKSVEQLLGFLDEYYIDNPAMNSGDMDTAIRDLLTDLLHAGAETGTNIHVRLLDAEVVRQEELDFISIS